MNKRITLILLALIALLSNLASQPQEPKLDLSIAGLRPGMARWEVEKIVGHSLENERFIRLGEVDVSFEDGWVSEVRGPELWCDELRMRATNMELLEARLGPADASPDYEGRGCIYAMQSFAFYRHSLSGCLTIDELAPGQFVLHPSQYFTGETTLWQRLTRQGGTSACPSR